MKFDAAAHRLGTAASLLSLDKIVPYYILMNLTRSQASAEAIKDCVREAILENRKEFIANPTVVPKLEVHLRTALDKTFGHAGTSAFFRWYKDDFVDWGGDFPHFLSWYMLLGLSRNNPVRWSALGLPSAVSDQACLLFCKANDITDIEKIEEYLEKLPLSEWDAHMYVIHGFNDDDDSLGKSPFMWVRETVEKHRFLEYLRWLKDQLSENERQQFFVSGNTLRTQISTFKNSKAFFYPFENL
jgi:hypothetical protein